MIINNSFIDAICTTLHFTDSAQLMKTETTERICRGGLFNTD